MKLKNRREERDAVEVRSRFEADDFDEVEAYAQLYQETYAKPIEPKALVTDIVMQFIRSDRSYQRWRRQQAAANSGRASSKTNGCANGEDRDGEEIRA